MDILKKRSIAYIVFGDILVLVFSVWASLFLRNTSLPSFDLLILHLFPFAILGCLWFLVFYIAGLYDIHTVILKSRIPSILLKSQIINGAISFIFFYFFPSFGIAPKTILLIYLLISFTSLWIFRVYGMNWLYVGQKQPALIIGSGEEMKELIAEVSSSPKYNLDFKSYINLEDLEGLGVQEDLVKEIYEKNIKFVAIDFSSEKVSPLLRYLYNLVFSNVKFIDFHKIYEDVFDRIPLSLVTYSWFLENISVSPKFTYDFLKRSMDICLSFVLIIFSIVLYPIIFILIKIDDGGKIFINQIRIGQGGKFIKIIKFRTMSIDDSGEGSFSRENKVTKIGSFLRKSRLDELPQLFNVFFGDLSLIGPRPELPNLVKEYEREISFYNVRHLIKPGLSGWAQLCQKDPPKFGTDYNQTKIKLSYDLFYIKNRSFILDIKIALKTVKILFSKSGV